MQKIEIKNLARKRIPPRRILRKTIKKVLKLVRRPKAGLNIAFLTDRQITELNLKFKKRRNPTDVLAFEVGDERYVKSGGYFLGDIAVSVDRAEAQSKIFKTSRKRELYLYIIHGILHLLGHEDVSKRGFRLMQKKQDRILNKIWKT